MLVKFLKDAKHPRKRSIKPDYIAGEIYPLSDDEAEYFIDRGEAKGIKELVNEEIQRSKTDSVYQAYAKNLPPIAPPIVKGLLTTLKVEPEPSHEIMLDYLKPKFKKELKCGLLVEK